MSKSETMKTRIARLPISMVKISAAGTWWSTKRVRKPSAAAVAVEVAAATAAAVAEGAVGTVADAAEADAAEIAATAAIAATAGNFKTLSLCF